MYDTDNGILLKKTQYKDDKYILKIYGSQSGLNTYSIDLSRGKKSQLYRNIIGQPMSYIEFEYLNKLTSEVKPIRELHFHYTYTSIPYDFVKQSIALFMNELLLQTLRLPQFDKNLYNFITDAIVQLDTLQVGQQLFPLWFTFELSKQLGFGPTLPKTKSETLFDISKGTFIEAKSEPSVTLSESLSCLLLQFLGSEKPFEMNLKKEERKNLLHTALDFYSFHGDFDTDMKSLDILHVIFD